MSRPDRESRLRELLEAVLDLPAAERCAALEEMTADRELAEEALALAEGETELGDFLVAPAADRLGAGLHPEGAPTVEDPLPSIPGLVVERPLGEGGMGRVFLARQTGPVERQVAVKMIRVALAGPKGARRFAAEQRAMARLNHPAIAQLYSAATTEDGQPYVVMEYVGGLPITEHCDRERLPIAERLRLFVAVCRGVEHAHRKQLLHRDLKPSNVLVTTGEGTAVPKIIDFGIAMALDRSFESDTLLTGAMVLGTPHYMSPEALQPSEGPRDLDTRADVYSLGVLLYELLTGSRPFPLETRNLASLLRRIAEEDPPRPSTRVERLEDDTLRSVAAARAREPGHLVRRLGGDLDWIALKALARDREERYGSAAELADDVERSLRDEPVTARPPSLPDRLTKLARRHRLAAALLTLTAVAVVAAAVISSVAWARATRAEAEARAEAVATGEALGFVVDLFEAARPEEALGRDVSARQLVSLGAERIEERDLAPLQRARLLHTLAEVQMRLGEYESGRELAAEALATREAALAPEHPDVLASLELVGNLARRSGRLDEAEAPLERLLTVAERQPEAPLALAGALNSVANLRWRQSRLEEAEELHARALALRRGAFDDDPALAEDVAASLNNLGVLLWTQGSHAEALPYLREAAALLEHGLGPDHPRVADALGNVGIVLLEVDRLEESEVVQRRALAIREKVLGPDHPDTSVALHNLGRLLARTGRPSEAAAGYRRALEIRRRTLGSGHPETIKTLTNLGLLLSREERFAEAEPLLREGVSLRVEELGERHRDVGRTLYHLGSLVRRAGRPAEAEALLRRALEIQQTLDPPRPDDVADSRRELEELAGRSPGS